MAQARGQGRRRLARFAPLSLLLLAAGAHAQPSDKNKVQLEYVLEPGAEACPSETVLRHAILAEMKVDPFSPTGAAKLRVVISRKGRRFRATYEIIDATGKPIPSDPVEDLECKLVVEAVGFDVGLHLPPLVTAATPPPDVTTTTATTTAPPSLPPPPSPP